MKYRIEAFPHNDLLNLAFYNLENINQKVEGSIEDGLGLDCLNCIVSLAFSVEAIVNYIGDREIDGWEEFEPYFKKIKKVSNVGEFKFDESTEPYSTLVQLKNLRDDIAHGKPMIKEVELEVGTPEELKRELAQPWDIYMKPEFVNHAFEMVKLYEHQITEAYGIEYADTGTKAYSL
ncbi:hypothetical protein [Colwellia sp. 20A7]|uniref:hypothetical protein n=1 Tax=Colwellia sp. 20A7 TaxID=2689569 RepID=UPI00135810CD|nr:hypothetical protein [Colwellia sp. 20A7]